MIKSIKKGGKTMYDLMQLEQAGFEFTPLEKMVFENPSFQILYAKGWPIKWGSFTTGISAEVSLDRTVSFKLIDGEKFTPHRAGTFFDEVSAHIRSVSILLAKVARDASDNEYDQNLLQDLSLWFDGIEVRPFRWIKFEREHMEKMKREAREAEVAVLSQGADANVVVLLLDMIVKEQRLRILEAVQEDCISRKIFSKEDRASWYYHMPWAECKISNESQDESGRRTFGSVSLVDCGDVPTIVKSIPRDFRRIVKSVRFKLSKSTFSDRFVGFVGEAFLPQFAVLSLSLLSEEERQKLRTELEDHIRKQKARDWDKLNEKCQVIVPTGRQKLNALLLTGLRSWDSWTYLLDKSKFWDELVCNKKIRVDVME